MPTADRLLTDVMLHSQERLFYEAFPRLYANRNRKNSPMERGLLVGAGWFDILWELSENIEPLVAAAETEVGSGMGAPVPRAVEVRERAGELVFTMGPKELVTVAMLEAIDVAGSAAVVTCELCGLPGRYKLRGKTTQTLCERHETAWR